MPFIAAVETNEAGHPLRVVFSRVKTFSLAEIEAWAQLHLAASATVISDGLACFSAVTKAGCRHKPEVVGTKRKSTRMARFNWVNTVLGNLKTATAGTYHAFDFHKYGYATWPRHNTASTAVLTSLPSSPDSSAPRPAPGNGPKLGLG